MQDAGSEVPDLVPARMVNEYAYCPRLAYLEWAQSEFVDNYETVDGKYRHRAVDREAGDLEETPDEDEKIHARSVWLSAPDEHLTARIDLLQGKGKCVTPVDYKRGQVPDTPEQSWEADRVQLCAQGLVLKANGYDCSSGELYYSASRTRVRIEFTRGLLDHTRNLISELRRMVQSGRMPPPLGGSAKCVRCSLAGICLPDETNLLAGRSEAPTEDKVRRLVPARDDSVALYVQEQGAHIAKRGEVFEVVLKRSKLGESRIFETSQISVFGHVQLTTAALSEAFSRGIPILFFTTGGWFSGLAHGMPHKNVELREAQFRTAGSPDICLQLASRMVAAKIRNCRTMLMRNHSDLPEDIPRELKRLARGARSTHTIDSLLGIEGMAAKFYFSAFGGMLKRRKGGAKTNGWRFDFEGRNRRPPVDPVNAMLSYAYSLLVKDLSVASLAVGFDPFMGFYHKPRYGRPALALDLMEEFRPVIADSVVVWVVNNGVLTADDFIQRGPAVALKPKARKKFIEAYERRLDSLVTHPVFGYRISYRRVLEVQTRLLARVLSGELPEYPAFRTR